MCAVVSYFLGTQFSYPHVIVVKYIKAEYVAAMIVLSTLKLYLSEKHTTKIRWLRLNQSLVTS